MLVVAQALYLFAPLLVAAVLSAVVLRFDLLRALKRPVDLGLTLGGVRLFGDNKTIRGFVVALIGSIVAVLLQKYVLAPYVGALAVAHYHDISAVGLGAALGLGAMLGELPNSFVKRRVGIAPGASTRGPLRALFYVWDQIDLLTGAWPLVAIFVEPTAPLVVSTVVLALLVHPLVSLIGWLVGARKSAR